MRMAPCKASILTLEPIPLQEDIIRIHDSDWVAPQETTGRHLASMVIGEDDQDPTPATVLAANQGQGQPVIEKETVDVSDRTRQMKVDY